MFFGANWHQSSLSKIICTFFVDDHNCHRGCWKWSSIFLISHHWKNKFEQVWSSLIKFEQVWYILNKFEQVWSSLNMFEQVWSIWIKFKPIWSSLNHIDPFWSNLIQFDQVWTNLIYIEHFDPIWSNLFKYFFDFMKTRYFSWWQQGLGWKGLVKSIFFHKVKIVQTLFWKRMDFDIGL